MAIGFLSKRCQRSNFYWSLHLRKENSTGLGLGLGACDSDSVSDSYASDSVWDSDSAGEDSDSDSEGVDSTTALQRWRSPDIGDGDMLSPSLSTHPHPFRRLSKNRTRRNRTDGVRVAYVAPDCM
ncbi:hypothetical protein HOLleu_37126 [Holothuria leucospilota]|uniref:Uncharacterized protein n=1 Tax=Holothuria leucospilota TaxID=206669 RepID=A0A9Q1BEJ1_HOLLE|nr:hypothetical protein HOLleu_37126 [Holothuria leucospilota]